MPSKIKLFAAMGAITMAMPAMAATTMTVSGGSVNYTGISDYDTLAGNVLLFNSSLGTLTGVTITSGYNFDSTITVASTTPASGSVSTQSAVRVFSDNAAFGSALDSILNKTSANIGGQTLNPAEFNLKGTTRVYSLNAGQSQTLQSNASMSGIFNASSTQLASFIATPTITTAGVGFKTLTGLNLAQTGGNANASQFTFANDSFSIMYSYIAATSVSAVPEPGTWGMMLLGVGVLGFAARRQRKVRTTVQFA